MLEANEMKVSQLRKIVSKTEIDSIRIQQIRESCKSRFPLYCFYSKNDYSVRIVLLIVVFE